jgi:hemolysin type calcium-binding protein
MKTVDLRRMRMKIARSRTELRWEPRAVMSGPVSMQRILALSLLLVTASGMPTAARAGGAGRACGDRPATILGTPGEDVLSGTSGDDVIVTGRGADRIRGLDGVDYICAGRGRDEMWGGSGGDRLYGGRGADIVRGGPGREFLRGQGGKDVLHGGSFADSFNGGPGRDWCGYRSDRRLHQFDNYVANCETIPGR